MFVSWPSNKKFSEVLTTMGLDFTPSEWQGVLLGLIAVHPIATEQAYWDALELEFGAPPAAYETLVKHCISLGRQALADGSLDLVLMLPADDTPLVERLESVSTWCQGFLYGVSLNSAVLDNPEIQPVLEDICKISEVGMDIELDPASQEDAFFELVEYVRMIPYFVFMTCAAPQAATS